MFVRIKHDWRGWTVLSDMIKLQHDTKNLVEGEVGVLEKSVTTKFLFEDPPSLQVSEEVLDLDSVLTDCLISFLVLIIHHLTFLFSWWSHAIDGYKSASRVECESFVSDDSILLANEFSPHS